ncbi:hypothetical protein BH10CHL1_BH10CHL1_48320 [soil metagenome]
MPKKATSLIRRATALSSDACGVVVNVMLRIIRVSSGASRVTLCNTFTLNGALTIGTLDGANIEIYGLVGAENFFLFGLTVDQVFALKEQGYRPMDYYQGNLELKRVIDSISGGLFSNGDSNLFRPIVDSLLYQDEFLLLADYASYIACQEQVEQVYRNPTQWTRLSILNTARCGFFSSDRTIRQYCQDIWRVTPVTVPLNA